MMADGSDIGGGLRLSAVLIDDLAYLAKHQRDDEKDQFCAVTGASEYNADDCARTLASLGGVSWSLLDARGYPLAAGGFYEVRPRVWETWMAGTPAAWADHWRFLTRQTRALSLSLLRSERAHRLQTLALAERTAAHRWYEAIGQQLEGVLRRYFADERDAVCYALVKGDR